LSKRPQASVLPVPEPLIRHHSSTLLPPMRQWLEQSRVPPVLLMTGLPGVGKRSVAYYLSQWLHCENSGFSSNRQLMESAPEVPENPAPCRRCPSCQRAEKGTWVDFTEISSTSDEGESGTLKIEQFRN